MNKLPINLCLFTTTKGHFGRKDVYLSTLSSLKAHIGGLNQFGGLFAHLKISPGEEAQAEQMTGVLESMGFVVIPTVGEWSHNHSSHHSGYLMDIQTMFNHLGVHERPYSLWLEDDFVFEPHQMGVLESLAFGQRILEEDRNVSAVRYTRIGDDDIKTRTQSIPYNEKTFQQGVEFSFNPTLIRTRDVFLTMALVRKYINNLSPHCELAYTQIAQTLTEGVRPFVCIEPAQIVVEHIGIQKI